MQEIPRPGGGGFNSSWLFYCDEASAAEVLLSEAYSTALRLRRRYRMIIDSPGGDHDDEDQARKLDEASDVLEAAMINTDRVIFALKYLRPEYSTTR